MGGDGDLREDLQAAFAGLLGNPTKRGLKEIRGFFSARCIPVQLYLDHLPCVEIGEEDGLEFDTGPEGKVGEGSYGRVYLRRLGTDPNVPTLPVVVKQVPYNPTLGFCDEVIAECAGAVMAGMAGATLPLYAVCLGELTVDDEGKPSSTLLLASKLATGRALGMYRAAHIDMLTPAATRGLARGLVDSLVRLVNCGLTHGDLKPDNVFIDLGDGGRGGGTVYLGDLGLCDDVTGKEEVMRRSLKGNNAAKTPEEVQRVGRQGNEARLSHPPTPAGPPQTPVSSSSRSDADLLSSIVGCWLHHGAIETGSQGGPGPPLHLSRCPPPEAATAADLQLEGSGTGTEPLLDAGGRLPAASPCLMAASGGGRGGEGHPVHLTAKGGGMQGHGRLDAL